MTQNRKRFKELDWHHQSKHSRYHRNHGDHPVSQPHNHPTLGQLYRDVQARKRRRERIAAIAFTLLGVLALGMFVVSLLTPQP